MYSLIIHFGITKYELSLTIYIGLLHMYHFSVLPPKQQQIPLIVSSQISIPNVSPNLTDAYIYVRRIESILNRVNWVRYATFCNNDDQYPSYA